MSETKVEKGRRGKRKESRKKKQKKQKKQSIILIGTFRFFYNWFGGCKFI